VTKEPLKDTTTVYVQLLDEGTVVFRPTQGERVSEGVYRLLPTPDYDPEDENWEFLPGQIVRCEQVMMQDGVTLVAKAVMVGK
jgi:hypothetical protein